MTELTIVNIADEMLAALPELRNRYEELLEWWRDDEPGMHIVFGDVFNPFVIELLESCSDGEILQRAFAFVERMANSLDERVVNIVYVTICEELGGKHQRLLKFWKYMGLRTKEIAREVQRWWRKPGEVLPEQ